MDGTGRWYQRLDLPVAMGAASSVSAGTPAQAAALLHQGDYYGAISGYTRALADGAEPGLLVSRSRAFLAAGCPGPALLDAEAAVIEEPQASEAHFRCVLVCLASLVGRNSTRFSQRVPSLVASVAEACAAMGYPCDALDAARRALALDGSHTAAAKLCGCLEHDPQALAGRAYSSVLTWGENAVGELGRGECRGSALPRPVTAMAGREVVDVSCGLVHTAAVTASGETWAWGGNGQRQCGMSTATQAVARPMLVPGLIGRPMRGVACGSAHTAAVPRGRGLWTWGLGRQGQLGHGASERASGSAWREEEGS